MERIKKMFNGIEIESLTVKFPYKTLDDYVLIDAILTDDLKYKLDYEQLKDNDLFFSVWVHEFIEESIYNLLEKDNLNGKRIKIKRYCLSYLSGISHILTSLTVNSFINHIEIDSLEFGKLLNMD